MVTAEVKESVLSIFIVCKMPVIVMSKVSLQEEAALAFQGPWVCICVVHLCLLFVDTYCRPLAGLPSGRQVLPLLL